MYSLPTGWHGINLNSPSKKSKPSSHPVTATTRRAKQQSAPVPQIERKKWNHSIGLDPSKIRSSNHASKKIMPVTKTRARSMANGGQELRTRTQEEVNVEIMALRKDVSQARDENSLLKGRLRRVEEDSAKKMKHFEKLLATAKRESLASEKRKESDAITMLKQKCARLEQNLKEKDASLKKLQQEKTLLKTREVKSVPDMKDLPNAKYSLDNKRPLQKIVPRANSVPSAEMTRLKESARKMQQDNASLQMQLKERDQEIKQLKMQLIKTQRPTPAPRRSLKIPDVRPTNNSKVTRNHIQDVKPTNNTNTSTTVNRSIIQDHVIISKTTKIQESKMEQLTVANGDYFPPEERLQALQKKIAAKRIQRGWREHQDRKSHESELNAQQMKNATNGITDEQKGEATILLQSVLRGHQDRLAYVQEKLEEEASFEANPLQLPQEE